MGRLETFPRLPGAQPEGVFMSRTLGLIITTGIIICGCGRRVETVDPGGSFAGKSGEAAKKVVQEGPMISEAEAIKIAKKAIHGKITPQKGSPINVEIDDIKYKIKFIHVNPPGVRGPDYDALVTIDGNTGEVVSLLGGP
jgi:hypothetical protein